MSQTSARWLDQMTSANAAFTRRIDPAVLPARLPGPAIITCIDPRINLEAIGIDAFSQQGASDSPVRIIRTVGGMAESRSLVIGMFLAGIREIAVLMHTDCGCCNAFSRTGTIVDNMQQRLSSAAFEAFRDEIGEPFEQNLRHWLQAFEDPRDAVVQQVAAIHALPFVPDDLIVHGLLLELGSGQVEVIVDGYTD